MFKFERLHVWKRSIALSVDLIKKSQRFPKDLKYSLGGQLQRAVLSIPTNIAEGSGRGGIKDQAYFYRIAKGSSYEVLSLLVVAKELGKIDSTEFEAYYDETNQISAMLSGLIQSNGRNS